jgi:hypothetical protein
MELAFKLWVILSYIFKSTPPVVGSPGGGRPGPLCRLRR